MNQNNVQRFVLAQFRRTLLFSWGEQEYFFLTKVLDGKFKAQANLNPKSNYTFVEGLKVKFRLRLRLGLKT